MHICNVLRPVTLSVITVTSFEKRKYSPAIRCPPSGTQVAYWHVMKRRLAIPAWQNAVASTFDFAHDVVIVDVERDREIARSDAVLPKEDALRKAALLRQLEVDEVVCGAISRPSADALIQAGLRVYPFVAGSIDDVLSAHLSGRLAESRFLLPGCEPGQRRRWRHGQTRRAEAHRRWR